MYLIMRSHWVDTAKGAELPKIGALYEIERNPNESDASLRKRIKAAVMEYKGGGTVDSIISLTRAYLGADWDEIELIDNPLGPVEITREFESGDTWQVSSQGIDTVLPKIVIFVESSLAGPKSMQEESALPLSVTNPKLTNLETNETIGFNGVIKAGQTLSAFLGGATLEGVDATDKLTSPVIPQILRTPCKIQYNESITEKVGSFDSGTFDSSLFRIPVAKVRVTLSWNTHLAATFELRVKKKALDRNALLPRDLQEFVSRIKGAGVNGIVTIVD